MKDTAKNVPDVQRMLIQLDLIELCESRHAFGLVYFERSKQGINALSMVFQAMNNDNRIRFRSMKEYALARCIVSRGMWNEDERNGFHITLTYGLMGSEPLRRLYGNKVFCHGLSEIRPPIQYCSQNAPQKKKRAFR